MMAIRRAEVDKEEMVTVNEQEAIEKNKEMKGDGDVPEEGWSRGKKKVKFGDFFFLEKKHIWSLEFTYFLTK